VAGARRFVSPRRSPSGIGVAVAGLLAAALLRVFFLAAMFDRWDTRSYAMVVEILQRGGSFFAETARYNYSPVWAYILLGLSRLGSIAAVPLWRVVSLFLTAVDAATALLLYRIARNRGRTPGGAMLVAAVFFANPISILVTSYRGVFDNFSILFLLLAVFYAERREDGRPAPVIASMSASLLVKHVTWFHPLLLAGRREKPRVPFAGGLAPYAVFLASFVPFLSSWPGIRDHVFAYRSLSESYGIEALRSLPGAPHWLPTAVFLAAALAAVLFLRRVVFARAALLLFLVLLIFAPGIVDYYFVWPVALGALELGLGYGVYTVVVTLFLIHSPDTIGLSLPHLPGWSGPWWALVFWFLWELRRAALRGSRRDVDRSAGARPTG
jgi:hypothetical protein